MIEVDHVTKMYGPHLAVDDISFTVNDGEIVGFLGPNGAGKSTTMKIITAFMPATKGRVVVAGYDVFDNSFDVKRNVGFLPEVPPVYLDMKVNDYVTYTAKIQDVPSGKVKSAVADAIEKTGLEQVDHRLIGNLSKGFRQRVGLAQAIVHNPKVLVLDEPTVGLDPAQIIEIRDLIKSLGKDRTVILSTHILSEVTATCDRVVIINQGRIAAEDTISNLTKRNIYTLSIKSSNGSTDSLVSDIKNMSGVTSVHIKGSEVFIEFDEDGLDNRDQVISAAVKNKIGVLDFSSQSESLEQVFIKYTS